MRIRGFNLGAGSGIAAIILIILGAVLALAATIVLFILVLPKKKRERLSGFFRWLHDVLNVKSLVIEKILHFFYVLNTMTCLFVGFFILFTGRLAGVGLLLMLFGPILVRLFYEASILLILLVKNTMEINHKLKSENGPMQDSFDFTLRTDRPISPAPGQNYYAPEENYYAPQQPAQNPDQGGYYNAPAQRICRHCGSVIPDGSAFCQICGNKVD